MLGLAAVVLQCVEYTGQHFGPTDGAYASVFCAWTAFYLIAVLCTMYWLETQVATELRERRAPSARPGEGVTVYEDPDRLLPRGLDAAVFYWGFLGRDRGRDVHDAVPPVVLATAAATPGFWDWSLDPPLVLVIDLAILYWLGDRRTVTPARKRVAQHWRSACFYASLVVLAIALASPIEILSAELFWVHMIQHVLADASPRRCSCSRARGSACGAACRWTRAAGSPAASATARGRLRCASLSADARQARRELRGLLGRRCLAWHVPALFDATLRSTTLHAFEHTLFFLTAVLFWKQVIPSPPLHARLVAPERVVYVIGAMIVSWALAVVLALAPHPLYSFYAERRARPGGISAMADQQLAAGMMWVPGSVTFLIVVFVYVHRWLVPPSAGCRPAAAAGERALGGLHAGAVPIASDFLTGSILTLALPLGVLIVVAVWYVCCGGGRRTLSGAHA